MAKVQIIGNAVVVKTEVKLEDIKLVEKYRPDALVLKGGEDGKEEIFRIGTGKGSINTYGASFDEATRDDDKFALITMVLSCEEDGEEAVKEFIVDKIGAALTNIKTLEKKLPDVIKEIKEEREKLMESITLE